MSTSVYQGRTTVSELRDLIRKLGGTPKGSTKAELQDQLEDLITNGGLTPDEVRSLVTDAVAELLPDVLENIETDGLSDEDISDIFGD